MGKDNNIKSISLSNLNLDKSNFRFDKVDSQRDAINSMILDQGDKLYKLAEDIATNGLNPSELVIVIKDPILQSAYDVLEGNRRVTALKLLMTPSIIGDENKSLRAKFENLKEKSEDNLPNSISCLIVESREEADRWIYRKHAGQLDGVGTVTWNSQQIQRFNASHGGKLTPGMQIISYLDNSKVLSEADKNQLRNLNITNFDRLLSDPYVRSVLGISLEKGLVNTELTVDRFVENIKILIKDLLRSDFKVKEIYKKEDRKKYIDEFSDKFKNEDRQEPWTVFPSVSSNDGASKIDNLNEGSKAGIELKTRKTIIPKSCKINIANVKLQAIFQELQKLNVKTYRYSCSVMLRVLLEGSVDTFINQRMSDTLKGPSSENSGEDLNKKVNKVIQKLYSENIIDKKLAKGINAELKDKNSPLSIDSLNAYVHNSEFSPKPDNLITGWDNIQSFFEILWKNINNAK